MTVRFSTAVRNAMLNVWESTIGASARLQIRTGPPPANCAAADSGTLLAEFALAADWAGAASGGAKALSGLPLSTTASASGTAGHYRLKDNAGTTCHEQGTVTASGGGGDMTIDRAAITSGQTVKITAATLTAPGA